MNNLEDKLQVGTKIKIGENFADGYYFEEGEIIELVEGQFEYDNGLYTEVQTAPSIWNKKSEEFDSIYHLFENDLSGFMDCEVIKETI